MPRALSKHTSSSIKNTTSDVHVCHERSRNSNRARSKIPRAYFEQCQNFPRARQKLRSSSTENYASIKIKAFLENGQKTDELDRIRQTQNNKKTVKIFKNRTRSKSLPGQTVRWIGAQFSICKSL